MSTNKRVLLSIAFLATSGMAGMVHAGTPDMKGAALAAIPEEKIEYIGPFPVKQDEGWGTGAYVETNQYQGIRQGVGFIRDWLVVGPFPNSGGRNEKKDGEAWDTDFLRQYGGESAIAPYLDMPVAIAFSNTPYWDAGSITQKWIYCYTWHDHLKLHEYMAYRPLGIYYPQCVGAYAACAVFSESERPLKLAIGADDDYKVWVNHKYIGGERRYGPAFTDQFIHDVTIKKGMNLILVKCDTDKNAWEFCARFLDAQWKPVTDLDIYIPVKDRKAIMTMIPMMDPDKAIKLEAEGKGEWLTNSYFEGHFLGEDMLQHKGVPEGKIVTNFTWVSKVFPDTTRQCWLYVPAQYTPSKPASFMIFLDGEIWCLRTGDRRANSIPTVMDNLIHKGDVPVTICLFIQSGSVVPGTLPKYHVPFNRHIEYDTINDRFARMLTDEIVPLIKKDYNLSNDPKDWAIGGGSSGATAATIAAFLRPDVFGKVWSPIASPQDIYGEGSLMNFFHELPARPLRIYLGSGTEDVCFPHDMRQALAMQSAGYDYWFVVTPSSHSIARGESFIPDSLRWLWRK